MLKLLDGWACDTLTLAGFGRVPEIQGSLYARTITLV